MKKGLSSEKAKKILSDGEVRGEPITKKQRGLFGAVASGAPLRKNLGGSMPPQKPKAKDTPKPSKHMAIGERPVLSKTASKMSKMRGY